jgi:DNA-binding NtrC family response regulator
MANGNSGKTVDWTGAAAAHMATDLRLAAVTDLPVLLSGTPAECQEIARELDRWSGGPRRAVEVVDCRLAGAVAALTGLVRREAEHQGTQASVLLQEVHALDLADQALLEKEIEEVRTHPHHPIRILASSSAPLFERVMDQLFSERLFYRLNMIHVVVTPAGGATPPVAPSA